MSTSDGPLVDNHLAFLAAHRGTVRRTDTAVTVSGVSAEFSCWLPRTPDAELPASVHTVRLLPGSGPGWPERLTGAGFRPSGTLLYMEAPVGPAGSAAGPGSALEAESTPEAGIVQVTDAATAEVFATVQEEGFREPGDDASAQAWWRRAFAEAAQRARTDPAQTLLLAYADGAPAAVTLGVRTGEVYGVYAVTTRPAYRARGLATALLARARTDAATHAATRLALQVIAGSPAERLYRTLGFTPAFPTPEYTRR